MVLNAGLRVQDQDEEEPGRNSQLPVQMLADGGRAGDGVADGGERTCWGMADGRCGMVE